MGINPRFNNSAIQNAFREAEKQMIEKVIRVLRYCGEMAVNEAKTSGAYQDQTGNLRSSLGYVVVINGKIQEENFSIQIGQDGASEGKNLAYELARQTPDVALIVVAGMKYASYVESRGINVLTSAEQMAKTLVPNLLKQLRS